jgi:toxin YhaV
VGGVSPRTFHGWTLLFNEPFTTRYGDLSARARSLREQLGDGDEYARHPDVKLFAAVRALVFDIVPREPDHPAFRLRDDLRKFRRVKGRGLPSRYRMYFVFSERLKVIIFLYLNDAKSFRKEGSSNDPYVIFRGLVQRGQLGADFDANYEVWRAAH